MEHKLNNSDLVWALKDNALVCVRVLKNFKEDVENVQKRVHELEHQRTLLEDSLIPDLRKPINL